MKTPADERRHVSGWCVRRGGVGGALRVERVDVGGVVLRRSGRGRASAVAAYCGARVGVGFCSAAGSSAGRRPTQLASLGGPPTSRPTRQCPPAEAHLLEHRAARLSPSPRSVACRAPSRRLRSVHSPAARQRVPRAHAPRASARTAAPPASTAMSSRADAAAGPSRAPRRRRRPASATAAPGRRRARKGLTSRRSMTLALECRFVPRARFMIKEETSRCSCGGARWRSDTMGSSW